MYICNEWRPKEFSLVGGDCGNIRETRCRAAIEAQKKSKNTVNCGGGLNSLHLF